MIIAYAFLSPKNTLDLGSIYAKREDIERLVGAEYPPGHVIYPDHKIVKIKIEVIT
jgi:hypothetical protein